jgi:ABC-type molybdate transport system substrate-binding protein
VLFALSGLTKYSKHATVAELEATIKTWTEAIKKKEALLLGVSNDEDPCGSYRQLLNEHIDLLKENIERMEGYFVLREALITIMRKELPIVHNTTKEFAAAAVELLNLSEKLQNSYKTLAKICKEAIDCKLVKDPVVAKSLAEGEKLVKNFKDLEDPEDSSDGEESVKTKKIEDLDEDLENSDNDLEDSDNDLEIIEE